MLKLFRAISLLEGLSYLAILSVTAGLISRDYVSLLGMGHGLLFMLYMMLSLSVGNKQGWSLKVWLPVFIASLVPLAFIPVECFLKTLTDNTPADNTVSG
ncbi:hypothetical protein SIN8267_01352 [Sinobacterium norvegicum]|uniref:DUF3817 domain-containing protein n=1 Tax=Sinobacterium norvegicum TaxID=1641715 RepID=A0ABM9ADH0_9GAMM|nr:DUF3817 domain-containing protein [Sinobacterium norvegicum]CAH0991250.1 hypothetical protein SIN8267_01352 [Sinobacterium norvegicum]